MTQKQKTHRIAVAALLAAVAAVLQFVEFSIPVMPAFVKLDISDLPALLGTFSLGPVYGVQWRSWPAPDGSHVDQIENLMQQLRTNPDSRRMIVCAWNPGLVDQMALPPCHCLFQFYVADGRLSCQLYQRSCDIFLGVPFNIASYALLTHMVAQQAGLEVGDFVWTGGDCHLYDNHMEQTELQLSREPRPYPQLVIRRKPDSIFDYRFEDFEITGYDPWPHIKAPVAV